MIDLTFDRQILQRGSRAISASILLFLVSACGPARVLPEVESRKPEKRVKVSSRLKPGQPKAPQTLVPRMGQEASGVEAKDPANPPQKAEAEEPAGEAENSGVEGETSENQNPQQRAEESSEPSTEQDSTTSQAGTGSASPSEAAQQEKPNEQSTRPSEEQPGEGKSEDKQSENKKLKVEKPQSSQSSGSANMERPLPQPAVPNTTEERPTPSPQRPEKAKAPPKLKPAPPAPEPTRPKLSEDSERPAKSEGQQTSKRQLRWYPVDWEKKNRMGRAWSHIAVEIIRTKARRLYLGATDITSFCPKYYSLSTYHKENVWVAIVAGMARFESNHKPTVRYHEKKFTKLDAVTGLPVHSEGLLQLSYQDAKSYPEFCSGLDWERDKHLPPDSPQKTIFDPKVNLTCGIQILNRKVQRTNRIGASGKRAYWSVLIPGGKYSKLHQIKQMVRSLPICN